jgi:hypothetical protein
MAIRRLALMLDALQNGGEMRADGGMQAPRPGEGDGLRQADVIAVNPISGATITVDGKSEVASQATDEPLRAGARVWVSRALDGTYVIHGSA